MATAILTDRLGQFSTSDEFRRARPSNPGSEPSSPVRQAARVQDRRRVSRRGDLRRRDRDAGRFPRHARRRRVRRVRYRPLLGSRPIRAVRSPRRRILDRPFRRAGVRLETIAQGPIDWEDLAGQLVYSVNQIGKTQFLRDLSRNTTRGLLASAREGRAGTGGPNPFGYKSKDGEVSIVPERGKDRAVDLRLYLKPGGSLRSAGGGAQPPEDPSTSQARISERQDWR